MTIIIPKNFGEIFGIFNKRNPEPIPRVPSELKEESRPMPSCKPVLINKEPNVFYSLGNVEGNKVRFKIGYEQLTMNQDGLKALIRQPSSFVTE